MERTRRKSDREPQRPLARTWMVLGVKVIPHTKQNHCYFPFFFFCAKTMRHLLCALFRVVGFFDTTLGNKTLYVQFVASYLREATFSEERKKAHVSYYCNSYNVSFTYLKKKVGNRWKLLVDHE